MSRLMEFRKLEQQLATQIAELETLKQDTVLKKEMEFEAKLRGLMSEYGFSLREIVAVIDPQSSNVAAASPGRLEKKKRRPRTLKVYRHPESGEVVQTKGGNHKLLKIWKSQFGREVETWLVN